MKKKKFKKWEEKNISEEKFVQYQGYLDHKAIHQQKVGELENIRFVPTESIQRKTYTQT